MLGVSLVSCEDGLDTPISDSSATSTSVDPNGNDYEEKELPTVGNDSTNDSRIVDRSVHSVDAVNPIEITRERRTKKPGLVTLRDLDIISGET